MLANRFSAFVALALISMVLEKVSLDSMVSSQCKEQAT
jgi:hypothetical protein